MGRRTRELTLAAAVCVGIGWVIHAPVRRTYVLNPALKRALYESDAKAIHRLALQGADLNLIRVGFDSEQRQMFAPDTPLLVVIARADAATVREVVSHGADVNQADRKGRTPLMHAAGRGLPETVEVLLKAGAEVNRQEPGGRTALIYAVQPGRQVMSSADLSTTVRALLHHGADPHRTSYGYTALAVAEEVKAMAAVDLLRKTGCDGREACLDQIAARGPLYATRSYRWGALLRLMRKKVSFRARDAQGTTLTAAAADGSPARLRFLLRYGRGLDRKFINEPGDGGTPLTVAARLSRWDNVKLLLAAGADPDVLDTHGKATIHYVAERGAAEALPYLLTQGASITLKNRWGRTPLQEAKLHRKYAIVRQLQAAGATDKATDMRTQRLQEALQRR